ncbi:hypothetical protein [Nocardia sp. BMG111209]|uniref:hypothetical protein n=1 Tax=Nocardia sp. BMG111209 TaxID=1160137 RepID=UPI0012DFD761|nr:hypothetical protein [Nocardia sp. BMG111209]
MGWVQVAVVAVVIVARLRAAGWLLFMGLLFTLGLLPVVLLAPLVADGFLAPPAARPLLVVADLLLLTAALTFPDGGDNGPLSPILSESAAASRLGERLAAAGTVTGLLYLPVLTALTVWTAVD